MALGIYLMLDVICVGEIVVDFIAKSENSDLLSAVNFEKRAGGAPANVAVGVRKLGGTSGFVGKAGDDPFGEFLKATLEQFGVGTKYFILDKEAKTFLAYIFRHTGSGRNFHFVGEPRSDTLLRNDEVNMEYISDTRVLHYGSLSLTDSPMKETLINILQHAKNKNIFRSYDPNLRMPLWKSPQEAKSQILVGMNYADMIKVSEEEAEFITGQKNVEDAVSVLHSLGPTIVFVTLAEEGAIASNSKEIAKIRGLKVDTVDSTGAGDGFVAGVLYEAAQLNVPSVELGQIGNLERIARFANIVGALTTTKYGAIEALPTLDQVTQYIDSIRNS